jgi:16S rRNA processing protein RimM
MADRICVAQIEGAHGLRGEVKVKSFTADPLAVKNYGPLQSEDGAASFDIETVRPGKDYAKGHLIAQLRGVPDRNAAERLRNIRLFVPRERLPPAGTDEFYHADLIGLLAVTADGAEVGTVVAVHDFGAGDILELTLSAGGGTLLLPFTEAFVPKVDIAAQRIVIAPPNVSADKRSGIQRV